MADSRLANFSSCCRLCLSDSLDTLKSVFDEGAEDRGLQQKISASLGVEILADDKLSTMVCLQCIEKINSWQSFKLTCCDNQTKLEQWMNLSNPDLSDGNIQIKEEPIDHDSIIPEVITNGDMPMKNEPMEEEYNELPPPLTPQGTEDGDVEILGRSPSSQTTINDYVKLEFECTQPELVKIEKGGENSCVPTKSSGAYQAAYQRFIRWCNEKCIKDYSENVLLTYFSEMETKMKIKSSTMWSQYSMIKPLLKVEHGVDISKYFKLRAHLKNRNEGYISKKSKAFTRDQFDTFLNEASDETYLGMKVVLITGVFGGCCCDEMVKMTLDHIEDLGSMLSIKLPNSQMTDVRSFAVVGENYLDIFRKYLLLRPVNLKDQRFFLKYANGRCYRSVMGVHTIGNVPKAVATYLKLPDANEFTGHCFRRTSNTWLLTKGTKVAKVKKESE